MKRLLITALTVSCIFVAAPPSLAKDTSIGFENPGSMRGVRPLGMGNAFLAMRGTDFNAQFYNPAAINDFEKKRHYVFGNPMADFNVGISGMISDVFDLKDDLNDAGTNSDKINVFDAFTNAHAGQFHRAGSSMPLFHIRHKYYAGGVILDTRTVVSLRNRAFPNFELKTTNDAGTAIGSAYSFFDDSLQVGGNLKLLYRVAREEQVTTNDVLNRSLGNILGWSSWQKGFGAGFDVGAKYALPFAKELLRPTVALTLQDIADTRFTGGAPKIPMSVSAGAGIFPKLGNIEFAVLSDFRETNQRISILKKFHFGVEAKFPEFVHTKLSVRAGTNQGYPAGGFTAEWPIVALNFAFYGEEMGEFDRSKANWRLASQLTFGF